MEELYLSSDALRSLSRLSRHLIINYDVIIKMSDPMLLPKMFHSCKYIKKDDKLTELFNEAKSQITQTPEGDATSFAFYVDDDVKKALGLDNQDDYMPEKTPKKWLQMFAK